MLPLRSHHEPPSLFDPVQKPGEWLSPFAGSEHILPGMRIWASIKEQHPARLVLMRMGDFYECFGSDAEVAAAAADLTLVTRKATLDGSVRVAMCGFPVHTLERYQAKLVSQGHALVICEQEEWLGGATATGWLRAAGGRRSCAYAEEETS